MRQKTQPLVFHDRPLTEEQGANTLLAYFHYCNKGIYPFSAECKDQDLQSLAELDGEAIDFVKYTRQSASEFRK